MKTKLTSLSSASTAANGLKQVRSASGFSVTKYWRELQLKLAATSAGRIVLHLLCLACDGRVRWHGRGLGRELARLFPLPEFPAPLSVLRKSGAALTPDTLLNLERHPATQLLCKNTAAIR